MKSNFVKACLFFLLMLVLSPVMIVLITIMTIVGVLYIPFDFLIYKKKYQESYPYELFITIKKRTKTSKASQE